MKYLNKKVSELLNGHKVTYRGMVYWASLDRTAVYAHSVDAEILGSITGYKVAKITDDFKVEKCLDA